MGLSRSSLLHRQNLEHRFASVAGHFDILKLKAYKISATCVRGLWVFLPSSRDFSGCQVNITFSLNLFSFIKSSPRGFRPDCWWWGPCDSQPEAAGVVWTLFGLFLYKQWKGHQRVLICIKFSRFGFLIFSVKIPADSCIYACSHRAT